MTWSEWQVALAYNNQLTEKNLRNVYQFLNLKQRTALKLKHLHSALKPHIQRLRLQRGTERDRLEKIIANVCSTIKTKRGVTKENSESVADSKEEQQCLD